MGNQVIPSAIEVINFKSDWDQRTSATGSVSFGTLHNPTLVLNFTNTVSNTFDVIIMAELNNLILYSTNSAVLVPVEYATLAYFVNRLGITAIQKAMAIAAVGYG